MKKHNQLHENQKPFGIKRPSRIVIYPKDIQSLTGKSYRQALSLNKEIRAYFKKKKHQFLSIYEFADYIGIHPDQVFPHIK